ncbi:hypothetical protein Tco_0598207 [Tanacetum coccineum]
MSPIHHLTHSSSTTIHFYGFHKSFHFKGFQEAKITIISPKQLFVNLTQDDENTSSPTLPTSSPSAPNAPSKTPSTPSTSPHDYLSSPISPPPRVSPSPPPQDNTSLDITLTLSPNTPLDVQFDTPSPSPPIFAQPIP